MEIDHTVINLIIFVLAVYVAHPVGGCLSAGDETSEVGLFPPDDLPELAFPKDSRILNDWRLMMGLPAETRSV